MKKIIAFSLIGLVLSGCESSTETESSMSDKTIVDETVEKVPESTTEELKPIWLYNHQKGLPEKNEEARISSEDPKELIELLNRQNAKDSLKLKLTRTSADTIYVKVLNSEILTQRMGSMGAHSYLSVSTFTLTEIPDVKFVNFEFKVGDHANPGTYSRKHFIDQYEANKALNQ